MITIEEVTNKQRRYAAIGVDTDAVLEKDARLIRKFLCIAGKETMSRFLDTGWQLTGGIMATRKFPRSCTGHPKELRQDLEKAYSLIPGKHKLNLHAIYLDTEEAVDLNEIEPSILRNG